MTDETKHNGSIWKHSMIEARSSNQTMPNEAKDIWFAVFLTEFIMIFIINAFTLVAFARSRHLRKRRTYLIISQTVADLLVGAVAGPVNQYGPRITPQNGLSWRNCLTPVADSFFIVSLGNLALISLERLHATLCPFKHCLVGKRVYYKIILWSWFGSLILASAFVILQRNNPVASRYAWITHSFVTVVLLTTAYVIIISKVSVRKSFAQRFSSVILAERKLSITLFIVTAASMATLLPFAIATCISISLGYLWIQNSPFARIGKLILALYYLNSILNPLIYAIRLPEFMRAVKELFCKNTSSATRARPIELRE